jgi:hypothetical protein
MLSLSQPYVQDLQINTELCLMQENPHRIARPIGTRVALICKIHTGRAIVKVDW